MCLYFKSRIFSNKYIIKILFRIQSQGTQGLHRAALHRRLALASNNHVWLQLFLKAVPSLLMSVRPITFIFDRANRCSQTLFFMGCLPLGFGVDKVFLQDD